MRIPKGKIPLLALVKNFYPQETPEKLIAWIVCGEVEIEGGRIKDPKCLVSIDSVPLHLPPKFVSRGGWKLEGALAAWGWPVRGLTLLDAGSSTGGFTDCLLQRGASLVHSVDVGRNQLHWKLRQDPRVQVKEGLGIMDLEALDPVPQGGVTDLSFRSLRGAARHILGLTSDKWLIALIKPQFEWFNPPEDFKGIVPEPALQGILISLLRDLSEEGVYLEKIQESPLRGTEGNREYLGFFTLTPKIEIATLLGTLHLP